MPPLVLPPLKVKIDGAKANIMAFRLARKPHRLTADGHELCQVCQPLIHPRTSSKSNPRGDNSQVQTSNVPMDTLRPGYIRLIHIEAGSDESPIVVRLVSTKLDSAPPYEGLSYTWGIVEFTSTVTCDGGPLPVTQNLYDALKYLRQSDKERIMWIDAICINQTNDVERSKQVGIMKDIYKKAIHVVLWLGKETAEDADAFTLLS